MQKYGYKNGRQQYKCSTCGHQFCRKLNQPKWIEKAYFEYIVGKTLSQLSTAYSKSARTIKKYFDNLPASPIQISVPTEPINLIFDATFFSRADGVLIFRANRANILWRFISSEAIQTISDCLRELTTKDYQFKSFTIDGRRGVIQLLEALFPAIPTQLCHFHQAQIIRRYTTSRPKTLCGKELKNLMSNLTILDEELFSKKLFELLGKYKEFLKEKNENNHYMHRRLRSAFRSLKSNLSYLFTYKKYPDLTIPNTTNTCDGSFAHWKQKLKIHRGLRKHRRNKMVNYLLK